MADIRRYIELAIGVHKPTYYSGTPCCKCKNSGEWWKKTFRIQREEVQSETVTGGRVAGVR